MTRARDSRFIQSIAPFDHVLTDFQWDLSKDSATPFSDFFGLPSLSRKASTTSLNTDWPTPLSSFFCWPMLSRQKPMARLITGRRILSLKG